GGATERTARACRLLGSLRLRATEVTAVMDGDSRCGIEPVLAEIEHLWVAVDADGRVAAAQDVVHARLLPQLAHEGRLVDDVAEADDGAPALALELIQGRYQLAVGAS